MKRLLPVVALWVAASLWGAASMASAQVGQKANLDVVQWLNAPPITAEQLQGHTVLVEVFRTWWGPCLGQVPTLSSKWDKGQDKGLVVIGVTDESPELVQKWLASAKPTYPIAITKGGFENFIKVPHFPYCAVIGPDGNLSYAGDVGMEEGELEAGLGKSKKEPLWPKTLAKVTKLMMGDPVKAYADLKKLLEGGKVTELEKPHVDGFVAYLEGRAKGALDEAKGFRDKGQILKAVRKVEGFAASQPPFPSSADSSALLKELQALPEFKKELSGGEAYLAAEKLEEDQEYLDAFEGYKSIAKKFAGTKIAENAKAKAEHIKTDGLAGFESACEACYRSKRACDKHKKDVKL